jgi:hypothetical protein
MIRPKTAVGRSGQDRGDNIPERKLRLLPHILLEAEENDVFHEAIAKAGNVLPPWFSD